MNETPAPAAAPTAPPAGVPAWRILLRMLSAFLALFCFAFWAAAGWNKGWTKTQIAKTEIEPITEIPHITYQDHFAPGVELLSLGLFVCVALFALTFIIPRRKRR